MGTTSVILREGSISDLKISSVKHIYLCSHWSRLAIKWEQGRQSALKEGRMEAMFDFIITEMDL
jgi:hypothetical protein